MNKRKHLIFVYVLCTFVVLFNTVFFIKDQFFYSMKNLPQGQFVYSSLSPSGTKSALFYRVDTPEGKAARIELVEFDDDMSVKKQCNIYWEVGKSSVAVSWESDDVLTVDDKTLDVSKNNVYDCRRRVNYN